MKFLMVIDAEPSKIAEVAALSDKIWSNPPKGVKKLTQYLLLTPMPVQEPGRGRGLAILEVENEQDLLSIGYQVALTGTYITPIPVVEIAVAPEIVKFEEKLKS
jgi:hypothetical protein